MSLPNIRVGIASWSEPEFIKAEWYPKVLPTAQQLPFYAERFDMVELNSSFYALTFVKNIVLIASAACNRIGYYQPLSTRPCNARQTYTRQD